VNTMNAVSKISALYSGAKISEFIQNSFICFLEIMIYYGEGI